MEKICLLLLLISAPFSLQKRINLTRSIQLNYGNDDIKQLLLPSDSKLLAVPHQNSLLFGSQIDLSCPRLVPTPMNSRVVYRSTRLEKQFEITCYTGYFIDTVFGPENCLTYICKNGIWTEKKSGILPPAKCQPMCDPPCSNGGICVSPNTCQCPANYYGPSCEVKNTPCASPPVMLNFSHQRCNERFVQW